jgi:aspartyl-tRNA(Asn)/glutamyl-tRNA(Gln) amidotransferase subunit B
MSYTLQGTTGPWEVVIGLEVHAQIISKSKLFSGASTTFGAEPNTQVSFVDAGFPGMLPVINRECVAQAVRTGLGLRAHINLVSRFDRKNYFYADLPNGYQISQYQHPIVGAGVIEIELPDGSTKPIGVTRLHLEQDAGKSMHDQDPSLSFIDLNRAGVALMEIVSEPDLRGPEEVGAYLRKLRTILRYLGTCDGNMDEGSMRADVNVSVRRAGEPFRTRCEVKNVNSIRFVMLAVEAEAKRQIAVWEDGGTVQQETRLFDPSRGETRSMRSKEEAHDYRYFPEPDLPPLVVDAARIQHIRKTMPELPAVRRQRLAAQYGLSARDVVQLMGAKGEYFDEMVETFNAPAKPAANLVMGVLSGKLNELKSDDVAAVSARVPPEQSARLVSLVEHGTISNSIAKDIWEKIFQTGRTTDDIIAADGLTQIDDESQIVAIIGDVLSKHQDAVAKYRAGTTTTFGFLVGQVMKAAAGKANPTRVNELLKRALGT